MHANCTCASHVYTVRLCVVEGGAGSVRKASVYMGLAASVGSLCVRPHV